MGIAALRPAVLAGLAGALALFTYQGLAAAGSAHPMGHSPTAAAKVLFGAVRKPDKEAPRAIGFYARGCLAGAAELPVDGPHWQVMRLSRNRNWGHPSLVRMIEHLANQLPKAGGWPGILIGDVSQPRGGPMLSGHASHQVGLDVDIWLTPWPGHTLSREERETMVAVNVVSADRTTVNPRLWTPQHAALVKLAAQDPAVERIFVNAAIKKALCRSTHGDRSWLHKVRPYWGHDDHIHVRLRCPVGQEGCRHQAPVPPGDGCGKELSWWFTKGVLAPPKPTKPVKPRPAITLAQLPAACRSVLSAP